MQWVKAAPSLLYIYFYSPGMGKIDLWWLQLLVTFAMMLCCWVWWVPMTSSMLSGLRSPWTIPLLWRYSQPLATWWWASERYSTEHTSSVMTPPVSDYNKVWMKSCVDDKSACRNKTKGGQARLWIQQHVNRNPETEMIVCCIHKCDMPWLMDHATR